jgi:hypothetical protein
VSVAIDLGGLRTPNIVEIMMMNISVKKFLILLMERLKTLHQRINNTAIQKRREKVISSYNFILYI